MALLWDNSLVAFIVVTCFVGGGAAFLTGRAIAGGWKPMALLIFYCLLITCVARFLHFALYEGSLLSPYYFFVNAVILVAIGITGYRLRRVDQMVTQYRWINTRSGPLGWKAKTSSE